MCRQCVLGQLFPSLIGLGIKPCMYVCTCTWYMAAKPTFLQKNHLAWACSSAAALAQRPNRTLQLSRTTVPHDLEQSCNGKVYMYVMVIRTTLGIAEHRFTDYHPNLVLLKLYTHMVYLFWSCSWHSLQVEVLVRKMESPTLRIQSWGSYTQQKDW